jgi:hypothetical protein
MTYSRFYGPAPLFHGPSQTLLQVEQREAISRYVRDFSLAEPLVGDPAVLAEKVVAAVAPQTTWKANIQWNMSWADEPIEITREVTDFGRVIQQSIRRFVMHVPISGFAGLLTCAHPNGPLHYPQVEVRSLPDKSIDGELVFTYDDDGRGAGGVKQRFDADRVTIESGFTNLVSSFEQHRKILLTLAASAIQQRQAQMAANQADLGALGMPVRKR